MSDRKKSAKKPGTVSDPNNIDQPSDLRFWGGPVVALVPAVVLVGVLLWLSLAERATITGFWVGGWAAIVTGLLLTRTPREFALSIVRGLTGQTGAIIILAYLFAGVFGKLLSEGGLVNGLLWFGVETGCREPPTWCWPSCSRASSPPAPAAVWAPCSR